MSDARPLTVKDLAAIVAFVITIGAGFVWAGRIDARLEAIEDSVSVPSDGTDAHGPMWRELRAGDKVNADDIKALDSRVRALETR